MDKIRVVEFEVVRTHNSGRAVFLNSHDPYQGYFEVVIFPDRWGGFPEPPEEYFDGKCVAVRGKIQLYQGTPEIVLGTAEDIQIVE
jgi:micrococcal nuclease